MTVHKMTSGPNPVPISLNNDTFSNKYDEITESSSTIDSILPKTTLAHDAGDVIREGFKRDSESGMPDFGNRKKYRVSQPAL